MAEKGSLTNTDHEQTTPNINGLYMALELMELGLDLVRQRFIRDNPGADQATILRHTNAWLISPRDSMYKQ